MKKPQHNILCELLNHNLLFMSCLNFHILEHFVVVTVVSVDDFFIRIHVAKLSIFFFFFIARENGKNIFIRFRIVFEIFMIDLLETYNKLVRDFWV
jgi:pilus assembly protein TadC